jgi:hypothetical protein
VAPRNGIWLDGAAARQSSPGRFKSGSLLEVGTCLRQPKTMRERKTSSRTGVDHLNVTLALAASRLVAKVSASFADIVSRMKSLKDRLSVHAEKLNRHEEMEAALAGVFTEEAHVVSEEFTTFANTVILPAFKQFKIALRELGRDAVIVSSLPKAPVQSIAVVLCDRYLSFGAGKTMMLVNPKDDFTKSPNAKFYEVFRVDRAIQIRQKVDAEFGAITTQVTYCDLNPIFLENELASFFERAYPTPL